MLDLFIFDIAGTTVRDNGLVMRAFRRVVDRIDSRASDDWVRTRMGWDKRVVFSELIDTVPGCRATVGELRSLFESSIAEDLRRHPPVPLGGALEAMKLMRQTGVRIGFTTGFSRDTALAVLTPLDWPTNLLVASDEVARGRPQPDLILECMRRAGVHDPARVGVAGDTPSDLQAGMAAGVAVVAGVGHGTHALDELRPHPHTHLWPDLHPLAELLSATVS